MNELMYDFEMNESAQSLIHSISPFTPLQNSQYINAKLFCPTIPLFQLVSACVTVSTHTTMTPSRRSHSITTEP